MQAPPIRALVVGSHQSMADMIREALSRTDLQPVLHARDRDGALTLAHHRQPGLIVLDFDLPGDTEALADALRMLVPNTWVIDFSGVLRRRPERAHVQFEDTRPLVFHTSEGIS